MDREPDHRAPAPPSGLGARPSGPEFDVRPRTDRQSQTVPTVPTAPGPRARPAGRDHAGPPHSRLPALLTLLAFAVVTAVVVVATAYARHVDANPPPREPVPSRSWVSPRTDRIEFASSTGRGELTIVGHTWFTARGEPPTSGSALQIEVEISCTSGSVGYDPYDFQAFDAQGSVFDLAAEEARGPLLGVGVLSPGQRVRGVVAFAIARGDVTLLMSDDDTSVTALRIPR